MCPEEVCGVGEMVVAACFMCLRRPVKHYILISEATLLRPTGQPAWIHLSIHLDFFFFGLHRSGPPGGLDFLRINFLHLKFGRFF